MGHGDAVAFRVSDADMGGLLTFVTAQVHPGHRRLLATLDARRHAFGIVFRGQLAERNIEELRITHARVLVHGRDLHGLGHRGYIVGRVVAHGSEIEVLQNIEHDDDHQAATGRLVRRHAIAPVVGPERLDELRAARAEIVQSDQTAVGAHIGIDRLGNLAAVKILHAILGDTLVSAPHVRITEDLADAVKRAVRLGIDLGSRRIVGQAADTRDAPGLRPP